MYVCGQEGRIQWLHGDVRCVPVCVIVLEGERRIGTLYCNRCICGREEEIHGHVRCVCVLVCGWRGRGTVEIGYLWGV